MADLPEDTENDDEIDGCDCELNDEVEVTPDEDLPAAIGGVE